MPCDITLLNINLNDESSIEKINSEINQVEPTATSKSSIQPAL